MQNFDFFLKTKLYFGKNSEDQIADILLSYGYSKVLILVGQGSVKRTGLLDKVIELLDKSKIQYMVLEGIRPNPTIQFVYDNLRKIKEFEPDSILSIGGGSVIDTGKSIAASYYYDGDPFDFNLHKAKPAKVLPHGVILTISAAGSEGSTSCVMQDDTTGVKAGFNHELNRPLFAICNPELTYSVNKTQTAYGIVDILMHTVERYFSSSNELEFSDGLAEGLIKEVLKAGKKAIENPNDYEARANLMLASTISHNGITSLGKLYTMPVHQLEHSLSGRYPFVAHAAGLAVLWPKWARYYLKYDVDKFDSFSRNVFHSFKEDKYENGLYGVECLEQYFKDIDMPQTFKDLGIEEVDINFLVNNFSNNGTRVVKHHAKPLDRDVANIIYKSCI